MKIVTTKTGQDVVLRQPLREDAGAIIDFYNMTGAETIYLSFCGGEYKATLEQQRDIIDDVNSSKNNMMLLAKINDEIIGIGTITSNQKIKGRHVGNLGIAVAKKYCNAGVGKVMMDDLISWCRTNHITKKLSLVTAEDNHRARALYEKCGFETEGILKNEICIDGKFSNLIIMGMMV